MRKWVHFVLSSLCLHYRANLVSRSSADCSFDLNDLIITQEQTLNIWPLFIFVAFRGGSMTTLSNISCSKATFYSWLSSEPYRLTDCLLLLNKVIVSSGVSSWLRPLWSPFGDWRIRLWCAVLGFCWDGPGAAGLQIPPALRVVSPFLRTQRGTSTQLPNMWLISFMQTSSTLPAFVCAKVYTHTQTHTHLLSFIEPELTLWHPLFSFKMSLSEADGWDTCVFMCLHVFVLCFAEAIIKDQILFWFWEPVGWAGAGFPLLREIYATFNLITMWSSSLFGLLTSWASYRKLCCWGSLFLFPDPKKATYEFSQTKTMTKISILCYVVSLDDAKARQLKAELVLASLSFQQWNYLVCVP